MSTEAKQTTGDMYDQLVLTAREREMMNHLMTLVAHLRSSAVRSSMVSFMFAESRPRSPFGGLRLFRRSYDAPTWAETITKVATLVGELPPIDYDTQPNDYTVGELIRAYPALRQLRDAAMQTPGVPQPGSLSYDTIKAMRLLKRLYRTSMYTRLPLS